jgi:hypothetical protein
VFHALSTITTPTLDILPHIEDTFLLYVTRRHSEDHRYWHATRVDCIHTQHALATVGSHGHLPNRLRLHHQDGVGRRLCAITGCCQDEDPAAGQRDCMQIGTFLCRETANTSFQVPIVSSATTQSALLNHNVYLTDRLDNQEREKMRHLRCLAFVRPSSDSIQFLIDELREPKYGEYHICTSPHPTTILCRRQDF